jgi:hypothetical protein
MHYTVTLEGLPGEDALKGVSGNQSPSKPHIIVGVRAIQFQFGFTLKPKHFHGV